MRWPGPGSHDSRPPGRHCHADGQERQGQHAAAQCRYACGLWHWRRICSDHGPARREEEPTYVLFNGAVDGYTPDGFGPLQARVGETVRIFMVCGGPNLTSSFHPIGNVWTRCWPQGALANAPMKYVQTQPVPPGSCVVAEMELPVPETIKLVDHALSRVARQGLLAMIDVKGNPAPDIYMAPA